MSEGSGNPDRQRISIPVDNLESAAHRLDAAADDMSASLRRLRRESDQVHLNDADDQFSRSRFATRTLAVADGMKRTTAHLRATAAQMADTAERARHADGAGADRQMVDGDDPVGPTVERLANQQREATGDAPSAPGWEQVWTAATEAGDAAR